ncbi:hypothetical protein Calkro_0673 [Caldicellulosiruptor kronotskyensis 2002]|uniref:Uncharacterized protein n=1 Tax=Caldicellulosiruptor kronotskyensis (strain DSM 18902 / VKM B-2412 / 2002) TaxID=632348 RepID=E4SES9_CALK2|nr:hypothetical protein [Caldicellulosiruptor kronotskyensis]ADQ45566.1 hypothetical protein Calkro_0673 [Caldicellulosiruptor kronotskyensis 2002]
MLRRIAEVFKDKSGVSEMMGSAFLLIFVVLVMATPLKNLGTTISSGYNNLNVKIQQQLNQIP